MKKLSSLFIALTVVLLSSTFTSFANNNPENTTKENTVCDADYNFSIQIIGAEKNGEIVIVPTSNVNFHAPTASNNTELNYFWDFGDGYTSIEANPTHTFNICGTYEVRLTVTDSAGNLQSDTVQKDIQIDGLCLSKTNIPKRYK